MPKETDKDKKKKKKKKKQSAPEVKTSITEKLGAAPTAKVLME